MADAFRSGVKAWLALLLLALPAGIGTAAPASATETPFATSHHQIAIDGGRLDYEATAGRLPVGGSAAAPHGHIFFTAYRIPSREPRPVAFIWNGGPGSPSTLLHFEAFGPRRLTPDGFEDNPNSLLPVSDLVFVDPIGTGFSRPASPEFESEFYSTLGDFESVAEFIRTWLERYAAEETPVFLIGESFGVWRATAVAELLERRGRKVAGIILISGGAGEGPGVVPDEVEIAMRVPNWALTALAHDRLGAGLSRDPATLRRDAETWARTRYAPALERLESLSAADREALVAELARYTGYPLDRIDRATLAITPRAYLSGLLGDRDVRLDTFDMRRDAAAADPEADRGPLIDRYFRDDLGYRTPLAYAGLSGVAGEPYPGFERINSSWNYNSAEITPEMMARAMAGAGPPGEQPWAINAVRLDPDLRILVAAGNYDSLNSCATNDEIKRRLAAEVSGAFSMRCYDGGHMIYRDAEAAHRLNRDIRAFLSRAPLPPQ